MSFTTDGFGVLFMILAPMKIVFEGRRFHPMIGQSTRSEAPWTARCSACQLNRRSTCAPFATPSASYRRGKRSTRYPNILRSLTEVEPQLRSDRDLDRPMEARMCTMKSHRTDPRVQIS